MVSKRRNACLAHFLQTSLEKSLGPPLQTSLGPSLQTSLLLDGLVGPGL